MDMIRYAHDGFKVTREHNRSGKKGKNEKTLPDTRYDLAEYCHRIISQQLAKTTSSFFELPMHSFAALKKRCRVDLSSIAALSSLETS